MPFKNIVEELTFCDSSVTLEEFVKYIDNPGASSFDGFPSLELMVDNPAPPEP